MNIYFDTEFTGLHKNTSLISLGMRAANGKEFYAEFTDYKRNQVDDWIADNVISHLLLAKKDFYEVLDPSDDLVCIRGNIIEIEMVLREWLSQFHTVQLVSDCCHYDMVLFISIFGTAFDLPKHVSPSCHDINQDIAEFYAICEKAAFDINREDIVTQEYDSAVFDCVMKHNALFDAYVIQLIHEAIKDYKEMYGPR